MESVRTDLPSLNLHDLQQSMQRVLLSSEEVESALTKEPLLNSVIAGGHSVERMGVYTNAYLSRLIEVLNMNYPALAKYLGEEFFKCLAAEYIYQNPSKYPTVDSICRGFPLFIRSYSQLEDHPEVAALGEIELRLLEAHFAPNLDASNIHPLQDLGQFDWEAALLVADPSLHLLEATRQVLALWRDEEEAIEPAVTDEAQDNVWLVLCRDGAGIVRVSEVSPVAAQILSAIQHEENLLAAIASAVTDSGESTETISEWFRQWVSSGILRGWKDSR